MNIQVDPTSSNLASAMLNSKIRPRAVVGYGVKIFHPSPPNYVTRSLGKGFASSFLNEPIHMPSVFEQLILSPEIISNKFSVSNSFTAESCKNSCCVISKLKELCFLISNFNTFDNFVLSNGDC